MSELISINDEVALSVLCTQDKEVTKYKSWNYGILLDKARKGILEPDPPVILYPLPKPYAGRFSFHLYNGNTRFIVARANLVTVNGLVVNAWEEIPEDERVKFIGLEEMFRDGLSRRLHLYPETDNSDNHINALLSELYRQELQGVITSNWIK